MYHFLVGFLVVFASINSKAQVSLFSSEEVLDASLVMDISYFRLHREDLRESGVPGRFTVNGTTYPVEVLSRGHGSMGNHNPPFKLVFNKKSNNGTLFEGIKKIKAFTTRHEESLDDKKSLLSNYLVYKLVAKIVPYAFKTRMFSITFIDSSRIIKPFIASTFLKEPNKNIAERINMTYIPFKLEGPNNPIEMELKSKVHALSAELINAFEFFAANLDYSIPGFYFNLLKKPAPYEKNMKMFKDLMGKYYPVPYDFDMSAFIDHDTCSWERGFNILAPGRQNHAFTKLRESCDKKAMKLHFKTDLNNFYFKNDFIKHYPLIRDKVLEWQNDYKHLLAKLSPSYIRNLNQYLSVVEEVVVGR